MSIHSESHSNAARKFVSAEEADVQTVESAAKDSWKSYVEKGFKVFLFVSTEEQYLELRDTVDRFYPKADVVIVISQENIVTGQKCHKRVMVRVS